MSRYYFDIHDGVETRDEIGRVIDGAVPMRAEALRVISALVAAEAEDAEEATLVLTVRDETDAIPLRIRLVCQIEEPSPVR